MSPLKYRYLPYSRIAERMHCIYSIEKPRWYVLSVGSDPLNMYYRAVYDRGRSRLRHTLKVPPTSAYLQYYDFTKRETAQYYVRNQIFRKVWIYTLCFWRSIND